jgi:hypothetical protein
MPLGKGKRYASVRFRLVDTLLTRDPYAAVCCSSWRRPRQPSCLVLV